MILRCDCRTTQLGQDLFAESQVAIDPEMGRDDMKRPFFYGWVIAAVAWVIYGFGIAPGYFSWGFLARDMIDDIGLTREQAGSVFGLFTFLYSASSPLVGVALVRWKLRTIICAGSLLAACGFIIVSRAESQFGCLVG